jgi:DNA-directed RNA polymerase specialized sigma subunit
MASRVDFRNEYIKTGIEIKVLKERLTILQSRKKTFDNLEYISDNEIARILLFREDNIDNLDELIDQLQNAINVTTDNLRLMEDHMVNIAKHLRTFTEMRIFILAYGTDMTISQIAENINLSEPYVKKVKSRIAKEINI